MSSAQFQHYSPLAILRHIFPSKSAAAPSESSLDDTVAACSYPSSANTSDDDEVSPSPLLTLPSSLPPLFKRPKLSPEVEEEMVRNIVVLGGSSHPQLVNTICNQLGIPNGRITLSKFAVGETRVEIQDSVRGKDVFVIQSGCGRVNDHLIELLITISACKTASAKRVTAVLPHFPYSRQSDIPYNKTGAPLSKAPTNYGSQKDFTFESRPGTPGPTDLPVPGVSHGGLERELSRLALERGMEGAPVNGAANGAINGKASHPPTPMLRRSNTAESVISNRHTYSNSGSTSEWTPPKNTGYKQWVAQAGTLVADLLTCAGADHIITMDLHDPQYQGFFDIPVDNLYGRPLLQRFIKYNIPDYQNA
ncbi:ribose-phosphate pyrophosphokinase, partial [Rhizina undulata]